MLATINSSLREDYATVFLQDGGAAQSSWDCSGASAVSWIKDASDVSPRAACLANRSTSRNTAASICTSADSEEGERVGTRDMEAPCAHAVNLKKVS